MVATHSEGTQLHLSERSASGYQYVVTKPYGRFQAEVKNQFLGSFGTAVEAAVSVARHLQRRAREEAAENDEQEDDEDAGEEEGAEEGEGMGAELESEEVVAEAEGYQLALSSSSVSGYRGVEQYISRKVP